MKAVLISIHPKWCDLIASGEKTIEVRKTRPKIETPFRCYIYETKARSDMPTFVDEDGHVLYTGRGQVIGEFVCDKVYEYTFSCYDAEYRVTHVEQKAMCLNHPELIRYGKGNTLYGWHISDLEIHDKPNDFCDGKITRPPQSWCYVEELQE